MKRCGRPLLLLGVVALLLLLDEAASGSSSHSLRNVRLALSDPSQGLPQFIVVGYVDDQPIIHYDSHTRRMRPLAPWMRKVEQDKPRFWDEESQVLQGDENLFRESLATLMDHFLHNSSTGLHTLQLMISCEVWPDGRPGGGRYQYAYDGEDFITFDKETPTWIVSVPQAEILKQKLGSLLAHPEHVKSYLEETCVNWLQTYLEYGKETLLRTESPIVRVALKEHKDGQDTLICQVYGFYPKEIEVTWMKDGVDRKPDTLTGGALPNSDGTYHTWLSIEVDPMDRELYRCHVEHDSLLRSQERVWEEPVSSIYLFQCGFLCVMTAQALFSVIYGAKIRAIQPGESRTTYVIFILENRLVFITVAFGNFVCTVMNLAFFIIHTSVPGFLLVSLVYLFTTVILLRIIIWNFQFKGSGVSNSWLLRGAAGYLVAAAIMLGIFIYLTSSLRLLLGILGCFSAAAIPLWFVPYPTSFWVFLGIPVFVLPADILLGVFVFPTSASRYGLLHSICQSLLASLILCSIFTYIQIRRIEKEKEERRIIGMELQVFVTEPHAQSEKSTTTSHTHTDVTPAPCPEMASHDPLRNHSNNQEVLPNVPGMQKTRLASLQRSYRFFQIQMQK